MPGALFRSQNLQHFFRVHVFIFIGIAILEPCAEIRRHTSGKTQFPPCTSEIFKTQLFNNRCLISGRDSTAVDRFYINEVNFLFLSICKRAREKYRQKKLKGERAINAFIAAFNTYILSTIKQGATKKYEHFAGAAICS